MNSNIKVDIEELLEMLKNMMDEGYTIVDIEIDNSTYYDDSTLNLKAIDLSSSDNVDYGSIRSIPDDF